MGEWVGECVGGWVWTEHSYGVGMRGCVGAWVSERVGEWVSVVGWVGASVGECVDVWRMSGWVGVDRALKRALKRNSNEKSMSALLYSNTTQTRTQTPRV